MHYPGSSQTGAKAKIQAAILASPELAMTDSVALQVFDKANDPDCRISDMAALVGRDPSLCARVLRVANSALFNARKPVDSIPAAISLLGTNQLRSVVLSCTATKVRSAALTPEQTQAFWKASVAGALAARALARQVRPVLADSMFVAGLVRDLGTMVLATLSPEKFRAVQAAPAEILAGFQCDLEDRALETNHAEIGAELLLTWRLPEEITEPVRCHHNWAMVGRLAGKTRDRGQLLYLASRIGQLQSSKEYPWLIGELEQLAQTHFSLDRDAVRRLIAAVEGELASTASLLQLEIGDERSFAQEIVSGSASAPDDPSDRGGERTIRLRSSRFALPSPVAASQDAPPPIAETGSNEIDAFLKRLLSPPKRAGTLGMLDGYEILDFAGAGSWGAVFRANDLRLGRLVAIKVMLPHCAAEPEARERFFREGRAVAALAQENVVGIYTLGETKDIPYLVMEFIEGTSLDAKLAAEGRLPTKDVIRIGMQTASGLAAAHHKGLIHRDIKPANLLIESGTGRAKLADFGLVHVNDRSGDHAVGEFAGTPSFMSPEQARGGEVRDTSDLFSLGSVMYLCATGQLPFPSTELRIVLDQIAFSNPVPVRQLSTETPEWLEDVIMGLLAKDPAKRVPATAHELKWLLISRWASMFTRQPKPSGRFPAVRPPAM